MSYSPTAPLKGQPRLAGAQAFTAIKSKIPNTEHTAVKAWIETVYDYAPKMELNPDLILGQAILETGWFTSAWWKIRRNSGGLGITGDAAQNNASQTWTDGNFSAIGHLAHVVAYVYGKDWPAFWPKTLESPKIYDVRFFAPIDAGYRATTLKDLNGTWAIDPDNNYHGKIADRTNEVLRLAGSPPPPTGGTPVESLVYGRVPMPAMVDRLIPDAVNMAWNNLGQRIIRGCVWHTMYGTLRGTDGYFRTFANARATNIGALTDFGVGVNGPDSAADDGVILLWNNPSGRAATGVSANRAPWANGTLSGPIGDALLFWQRYGTSAINRDLVSIERSGNGTTALTPKSRAAIVALTAYYADQYKVPWTDFPFVVPEGRRSFVLHHGEINAGKRNTCPGPIVEQQTNDMILQVKEILRQYQTGIISKPGEPVPPPQVIEIVPGIDTDMALRLFGIATGEDNKRYPFNIDGPISKLWIERGKKEQAWPPLEDVWVYADGRRYFRFENGWMALAAPGQPERWV
jgi:hypothetical protein